MRRGVIKEDEGRCGWVLVAYDDAYVLYLLGQ